MAHIRRIYIDSRHRSSGTGSDFTFDVPGGGISVPDNTIGYVDSVLLNNVFTTIHSRNNRLYLSEWSVTDAWEKTILLQEGNYTGEQLAKHLKDSMNAHKSLSTPYEVVFNEKTGQITISNTDPHWSIPTRHDLINAGGIWTGSVLDKNDLHECYDAICYTDDSYVLNGVLQHQGFVDLIPSSHVCAEIECTVHVA